MHVDPFFICELNTAALYTKYVRDLYKIKKIINIILKYYLKLKNSFPLE